MPATGKQKKDKGLPGRRLGIVIPVLNESDNLAPLLDYLDGIRDEATILYIDGGSRDNTVEVCQSRGYRIEPAAAGRSRQMNTGARLLKADAYWFLHADCLPTVDSLKDIQAAIESGFVWGRFDVSLTGTHWLYPWISRLMNWRSCWTAVATGDQGIFVRSDIFTRIGGYPDIPLMEDIAISKLLRRYGRPACIHSPIQVSSRRWERRGVFRTILLMWMLRLRYFLGEDPGRLHQVYYGKSE